MSYPKGTCLSCGGPTSTAYTPQCRQCYFIGRKPTPESIERQKKVVSDYNKKYALAHKKELREYKLRQHNKLTPEQKKEKQLKYKYGIDLMDFEALYITQHGQCGVCKKFLDYKKDKMVMDHNHTNGHIRLILCPQCNSGLGFFKENIETLKNAIKYLGGTI